MNSMNFFPTLTDELVEDAGIKAGDFRFAYSDMGGIVDLKVKKASRFKLEDPRESWNVETDGLRVTRDLFIEYPDLLKGVKGLVCKGAEYGICIIWTNHALSQMGYILPEEAHTRSGMTYHFEHDFLPGELKGALQLETVLFVRKGAEVVRDGEELLINKAGVTVGTIDGVRVDFAGDDMVFPIMEIDDAKAPLWWLEMNQWEDPTEDPFNEDYVCLYLNTAYGSCPLAGGGARSMDMLVEIISTAYLMMFQELIARDCLDKMLNNVDLAPGSIAKILFYFYDSCDPQLRLESIDALQKSIYLNVEKRIKGGETDEN